MKPSRFPLSGSMLALSLALSAGCTKEPSAASVVREQSKPAPAPAAQPALASTAPTAPATADPFAEMTAALERATLEQLEGLANLQQRLDQDLDAQVAAKKASADVSLAAGQKLDRATAGFAEKLRSLSTARPETWNTAKYNAQVALQNVRTAFSEVMDSPERR